VQDRYAGDIGDFGKYGLLRYICFAGNGISSLRLGVNWYLVPDTGNAGDGGFTEYLQDDLYPLFNKLRICDPKLYETLKNIVLPGKEESAEALRLRYNRGTAMEFILIPNRSKPWHQEAIERRIRKMLGTEWKWHFKKLFI
jgi:hypothetical protein